MTPTELDSTATLAQSLRQILTGPHLEAYAERKTAEPVLQLTLSQINGVTTARDVAAKAPGPQPSSELLAAEMLQRSSARSKHLAEFERGLLACRSTLGSRFWADAEANSNIDVALCWPRQQKHVEEETATEAWA